MRIKGGTTTRRRHNKVLSRTKGFRMTKGRLYKVSKEASLHAGQYAFAGRKKRRRDLRRLWITRLSAYLRNKGISYSRFIAGLKRENIVIDRKILADLAIKNETILNKIIEKTS